MRSQHIFLCSLLLAVSAPAAAAFAQVTISPTVSDPASEEPAAPSEPRIARDLNAEYASAVSRHQRGDSSGAIREFKEIAEQDPFWADVFYNIGTLSLELSRWHDCAFYLRRYLMIEPGDSARRTIERNIAHCESGLYSGGNISVTVSSPENATIAINGIPYGTNNTTGSVRVARGEYTVTISAFDHEPQTHVVSVTTNAETVLDVALTPIPQYGSVKLEVVQDGAEVRIDGELVGTTPLADPIRLRVATYMIEVTKEGYHPWRRSYEALRDLDEVVQIRLIDSSVNLERLLPR